MADAIRLSLLDGSIAIGTRLPSERDLAVALGVSRTTTTAAYRRLRDQGYLVSRRGSGSTTAIPTGVEIHRPAAPAGSATDAPGATINVTIASPSAAPGLLEAYRGALEDLPVHLGGHGYEPYGLPELRQAVADRYAARGLPTRPDQILITSGAQQGIVMLLGLLVGPGDRVAVEHPTYPDVLSAVRAAGARAVPVPVDGYGVDVDQLESTLRQSSPRVVHVTPDFHNPTGQSLPEASRARIRDLARAHRTRIISDETPVDLALDGPAGSPLASADNPYVVTVGSASKTFWGGLRVGWVRAPRETIAQLSGARLGTDFSTAILEQLAVTRLLADPEPMLHTRRAVLAERREVLLDLLAAHLPTWKVRRPAGGVSLWVDLGAPVASAFAVLALNRGVALSPGTVFGLQGSFERFVRLTYTEPPDVLERMVAALAHAWAVLGAGER